MKLKKIVFFILTVMLFTFSCLKNNLLWKYEIDEIFSPSTYKVRDENHYLVIEIENQGDLIYSTMLILLNRDTGEEIERIKTLRQAFSFNNDILYYISADEKSVLAFHIRKKEKLWSKDISALYNTAGSLKILSYADKLLLSNKPYEKTYCLNSESGDILWTLPFGYDNELIDFDQNVLYIAEGAGYNLYKVDLGSGMILWKSEKRRKTYSIMRKSGNMLIGISDNPERGIIGIDLTSKEVKWNFKPFTFYSKSPEIVDGIGFFPGKNVIIALDLKDGKSLWENRDIGNNDFSSFVIKNYIYYPAREIAKSSNMIFQIDLKTGQTVKKLEVNNTIDSNICFNQDTVYYISDSIVYAESLKN